MNKNPIILIFSIILLISSAYAQRSNGKVHSLIAAEKYFADLLKEKGSKKAFLTISDENTLIFRPDPVKVLSYFDNKPDSDPGLLSWQPAFAKISRSGDWGFTTGPYVYTLKDGQSSYGQYVSVWKADKKRVWKLDLDLGIAHPKPIKEFTSDFKDPENLKFDHLESEVRSQQRKDIIMGSDILFSSTLITDENVAYNTFLSTDARLLFPGFEPIIGKQNIIDFLAKQEITITTEPKKADRATGGDLAYTYGRANIVNKTQTKTYNYVRIWEIQEGYNWNVILEIFTPAGL